MGVNAFGHRPMPRAHAEFFGNRNSRLQLVSLWINGEFEVQLPIIFWLMTEVPMLRHAMRWAVGQDLLMFYENLAGPWSYSENELPKSAVCGQLPCLE